MKKSAIASLSFLMLFFLASCSGGSSSASTTDSTAADNFDVKANWKLGVQMWTFNKFTFAQALDKVDSAGIKYIEAFWGMPLGVGTKDSFGISMSDESKTKIKQLLQSKGIQIVAMGVINPDTKDEWRKAFDLAKEFGLSYITAEPDDNEWSYVDSLAGAYNIKIAIHDHPIPNHYATPDSVLAAMQGHPNIGSCADVGHWSRNGLNVVDCLKKLEGHVYGVHLKDITEFGNHESPDTSVSHGKVDFPAIFAELKRQHFSGMLSIEQESNWYNSLPDVMNTKKYFEDQEDKLK